MDAADKISRRMRLLFWLTALGFFFWQAGDGLARAEFAGPVLTPAGLMAGSIGFGVWIVALILVLGVCSHARRAGVYDILGDEWAQRARAKAGEAGFWVLTVSTVIFMTLSNFGIDAQFLLKILTGISASSYLIAYALFDARHDDLGDTA